MLRRLPPWKIFLFSLLFAFSGIMLSMRGAQSLYRADYHILLPPYFDLPLRNGVVGTLQFRINYTKGRVGSAALATSTLFSRTGIERDALRRDWIADQILGAIRQWDAPLVDDGPVLVEVELHLDSTLPANVTNY